MKKLNKEEMMNTSAGAISAALYNAIWAGANTFVNIGRYLGSSLRRIVDKNLCRY